MRNIIFTLLMLGMSLSTFAARSEKKVKPITGTWINLPYKDVRNKYTNPLPFDNTDPVLWKTKVRELAKMGIEFLVLMEVANEGKAYYPSQLMPPAYNPLLQSPVEAIMEEADKLKLKVFMSTGWAKNHDDNMRDPAVKKRQLEIMEETAKLFGHRKSFYGWYLPVEDCLCPILNEHAVQAVNSLVSRAHELTPGKKTLISPYGIGLSDFDHPDYESQLAKLKVDIIAYQDEVGCLRDRFTLPRLKKNWERMRKIHDKLDIEMWANCETFTWEQGTNDRQSALLPAAYSRLLSQQVAASAAGVDRIISFMFQGIIENPDSPYQLGQPVWSNIIYRDYMDWRAGECYWKLMESTFLGELFNKASSDLVVQAEYNALFDGRVAEENMNDTRWIKFEKGYHELVVDLKQQSDVRQIMLRYLNYPSADIVAPMKTYLYVSEDSENYRLISIKDSSYFPNGKHDAWIDAILFDGLKLKSRYVKVAFETSHQTLIDELFINPSR